MHHLFQMNTQWNILLGLIDYNYNISFKLKILPPCGPNSPLAMARGQTLYIISLRYMNIFFFFLNRARVSVIPKTIFVGQKGVSIPFRIAKMHPTITMHVQHCLINMEFWMPDSVHHSLNISVCEPFVSYLSPSLNTG